MNDNASIPVVILCGGMGTRLREASERLPKPMVDIGGQPILWHIMKIYGHYGFRRFILALGYKSEIIKRYFLDYRVRVDDFTLQVGTGRPVSFHGRGPEDDFEITFVETGLQTGTGARVRRVADYIDNGTFMLTYGDGIGDVDLAALLKTHREAGRLATVTGVHPGSRYGEMTADSDASRVIEFNEKPTLSTGWVSGGFFVLEREFIDQYLDDDAGLFFEEAPLQKVARDGQLSLYRHEGFWMGMDTYRDWLDLNGRWDAGDAPWRVW